MRPPSEVEVRQALYDAEGFQLPFRLVTRVRVGAEVAEGRYFAILADPVVVALEGALEKEGET